jgi:hypothetical protein
MHSISEVVGNIFTDGVVILSRRKNSVDKTVKYYSEITKNFYH